MRGLAGNSIVGSGFAVLGKTMITEAFQGMWAFTADDKAFARSIVGSLPDILFDAHAHLYRSEDISPPPAIVAAGPARVGVAEWRRRMGRLVGARRLQGALCIPYPSRDGDINAANRFVLEEVRRRANMRALLLVSPSPSRKEVERSLDEHPRIVGFKLYHFFAQRKDTFQCRPEEYVPHWAWELAEERGLLMLIHLVRDRALADPANHDYIRRQCARYPRAKVILAHAARGFHSPNTVRAITSLRELENVWFDSSAICETDALAAILAEFGPRKLMWGSDFPISHQRGRAISIGDGFAWVTTDNVDWRSVSGFSGNPVLIGLESLKALLDAADRAGLNEADLRDLFHDNAARVTGLLAESSGATQELYRKARAIIPGGTQLLSKRPEMFAPEQWPAYFREARGCEVRDLDGRRYIDVSIHGIGAALLGYRDPDVTRAVQRRIALGSFCTLNPPEEVELAELLIALHPWAEQARFARAGGEAMAAAVRIARATTDRSPVAISGYHGWHDWYVAANLGECDALRGHLLPGLDPLGVPHELRGTTIPFQGSNREEFDRVIAERGSQLAAVVMEPCRFQDPQPGFLEYVRDQARRVGALLIFDEITIGWRTCYGGAHLRLGVAPDIAVFGKALGNGHPMAAIIGTREAMEGAHGSFISSTFWTEGVGPAAALATLEKMARVDVPAHCQRIGARVQDAWRASAETHRLPVAVEDGYPALAHFAFDHDLASELKTLYTQSMLDRGFLASTAIYVTLAHTDAIIDRYVAAIDEVFGEIAGALRSGSVADRLRGPVCHSGFRRLL